MVMDKELEEVKQRLLTEARRIGPNTVRIRDACEMLIRALDEMDQICSALRNINDELRGVKSR